MNDISLNLDNDRFWKASNLARAAMPLSDRSVSILEACEHATHDKPQSEVSFGWAWHLREKGLLDYRGFDKKLGSGGHFITDAGRAALRQHRAR